MRQLVCDDKGTSESLVAVDGGRAHGGAHAPHGGEARWAAQGHPGQPYGHVPPCCI